jgi:hypothetical protein
MSWRKVAIIAGGGDLPVTLAQHCAEAGIEYYVARIVGMAAPALNAHPGADFGLGEMGGRFKAIKEAGCDAVSLVGIVKRPDFSSLKLDARGMMMMPKIIAAAKDGDDALLRVLVAECEKENLKVLGAEEVVSGLLANAGALGAIAPGPEHQADIEKAAAIAAAIGALDIGQGCVVCDGLVLAVEAAEGTDAMLTRVAALPEAIRGKAGARRGVLVKRTKPAQERRIDLPTLGLATIEKAAAAGLAGVAMEAGGALLLQRQDMLARADALGLFVYGFTP